MILAHDLGTTANKAALYDDAGALVAARVVRYGTHFGPNGIVEQDPADWWRSVCEGTRSVLAAAGDSADGIEVVSFSGQMMGAALLGGDGEPVRPALIWADTRSGEQCDRLTERIGMQQAYRLLGHRLNPTYSLTKVMWVREHEPEAWSRVRHVAQAKDYIAAKLTGRLVTDPSDASSTNAFDQERGAWSAEMLAAAELHEALWPEVVPSTTVIGKVTREAACATGLVEGTPVVIGGGDGPLAALGAGVIGPESGAYVYLGSSSWVSIAADRPLHDPQMRTMTFNHVVPGRFVPTATMQAGGASVDWVAELLETEPAVLSLLAAGCEAAFEGLLFLPHLLGERSPYWNPRARGALIGLRRSHGRSHVARAVLEGVAFNLLTAIAAFREMGEKIASTDAIGGGAVSDTWLQLLADVWGVEVRRRSLIDEANALGAAVVGGVAIGLMSSFDLAPRLSAVERVFTPDFERHRGYAERHAIFLSAYARLEELFDVL